MTGPQFLELAIYGAQILVILSIMLGFIRLALGPSLPDRIIALDMMTVSIAAFCAIFAIERDNSMFLDIVVVLGLVGFLATVAMARFSETWLRRLAKREDSV
jgi:multisubunit Na+/H+ antiporter MnhF subunit